MNNIAFYRSIRQVLQGGAAAQAISLGVMVLIAKIYTPAEVGRFYVWLAFLAVLDVISTARYDLALFCAEDEKETRAIAKLILCTVGFFSLFALCLLYSANLLTDRLPDPVSHFVFGLALAMCGMGLNKAILAIMALRGDFAALGLAKVWLAASIAVCQVLAGIMGFGIGGLIYGQTLGILLATLLVGRGLGLSWLRSTWAAPRTDVVAALYRYSRFPVFSLPADLINTVANQLPMILIVSRFGADSGGWFALTVRALGAPVALLATSVLDVFKTKAAEDYRATGNCRGLFLRTLRALVVMAILPFLLIWSSGEWLFVIVFGGEWSAAGVYAAILAPLFYCRFVVSPLSYVVYIAQKQHLDLLWQSALLLVTCLAFYLSQTAIEALTKYSIGYAAMYGIYLLIAYHSAKGNDA